MGIIFYLIVFVFGLIVGSFLNCVIYRLGANESLEGRPRRKASFLRGRSYCPRCKHALSWRDLIPIFSFLILKGRCRYCQQKISWQYPLVEIATALLFLLIFNFFQNSITLYFLFLISCFLIIIFVFDLKYYIIPDKVIFPAIIIAFFYNSISNWFYGSMALWLYGLTAAFGVAAFFLIIILISKGKWMGLGDVKLAFFMGLLLGFPNILVALFLAFLIGAIIGVGLILAKRKHLKSEIPFGPFLITGTFIALFWGQAIAYWYLNLFNLAI